VGPAASSSRTASATVAAGRDEQTGVEATRQICATGLPTRVAVMSALDNDHALLNAALAAGASVFVARDDLARDAVGAVLAAGA
jgi:DNA-binding NarL/FixJ family response regulator